MIPIHSFAYLQNPDIAYREVSFTDRGVAVVDQELHVRIYTYVVSLIATLLSYIGIQLAVGADHTRSHLLDSHIEYLNNRGVEDRFRPQYIRNLNALINSRDSYITNELREDLRVLLNQAADHTFRSALAEQDVNSRVQQLRDLRQIVNLSDAQVQRVDAAIFETNRLRVQQVLESGRTYLDKVRSLTGLQAMPSYGALAGEINDHIEQLVVDSIEEIQQSQRTAIEKYHTLIALLEPLSPDLQARVQDRITAAKLQALQMHPKIELVTEDFIPRFFGPFAQQLDQHFSANPELFNFFLSRFSEQFNELITHISTSGQVRPTALRGKIEEATRHFNLFICARFYKGYIESSRRDGHLPFHPTVAAQNYREKATALITAGQAARQERRDLGLAYQVIDRFQFLTSRENLSPHLSLFLHASADMQVHKGPISQHIEEVNFDEMQDFSAILNAYVTIFLEHSKNYSGDDLNLLRSWFSEAIIYTILKVHTLNPGGFAFEIDRELEQFFRAELPTANSYLTLYHMLNNLDGENLPEFAEELRRIYGFAAGNAPLLRDGFLAGLGENRLNLEEDDPYEIFTEERKSEWFAEEVFRSFQPELIEAFNSNQPNALQDWMAGNLDALILDPVGTLFDLPLLQNWAGNGITEAVANDRASLFNTDILTELFSNNLRRFIENTLSLLNQDLIHQRQERYNIPRKGYLAPFQAAIRNWVNRQLPEYDLREPGVMDAQRVVKDMFTRIPQLFDVNSIPIEVEMDHGATGEVVAAVYAEERVLQELQDAQMAAELAAH